MHTLRPKWPAVVREDMFITCIHILAYHGNHKQCTPSPSRFNGSSDTLDVQAVPEDSRTHNLTVYQCQICEVMFRVRHT